MQGNWAKIGLVISIIITGALIIGFIAETTGIASREGEGGSGAKKIYFMCENPDCEAVYSMSMDKYGELISEVGPMAMVAMRTPGSVPFECKKCGEKTAYIATKCPKCGELFIQDYQSGDYPDRCPECGYSAIEESSQR